MTSTTVDMMDSSIGVSIGGVAGVEDGGAEEDEDCGSGGGSDDSINVCDQESPLVNVEDDDILSSDSLSVTDMMNVEPAIDSSPKQHHHHQSDDFNNGICDMDEPFLMNGESAPTAGFNLEVLDDLRLTSDDRSEEAECCFNSKQKIRSPNYATKGALRWHQCAGMSTTSSFTTAQPSHIQFSSDSQPPTINVNISKPKLINCHPKSDEKPRSKCNISLAPPHRSPSKAVISSVLPNVMVTSSGMGIPTSVVQQSFSMTNSTNHPLSSSGGCGTFAKMQHTDSANQFSPAAGSTCASKENLDMITASAAMPAVTAAVSNFKTSNPGNGNASCNNNNNSLLQTSSSSSTLVSRRVMASEMGGKLHLHNSTKKASAGKGKSFTISKVTGSTLLAAPAAV